VQWDCNRCTVTIKVLKVSASFGFRDSRTCTQNTQKISGCAGTWTNLASDHSTRKFSNTSVFWGVLRIFSAKDKHLTHNHIWPTKMIIRMDRDWFWVARSNFGVKGPPCVCLPQALLNFEFLLHVLIWLSKEQVHFNDRVKIFTRPTMILQKYLHQWYQVL